MAYERLGDSSLDYKTCRYGTSKLLFRGPKRRLNGRYAAFLGGTETYGKFIERPFPALVESRTGVRCVNFGWPNAGVDVFLNDPEVLSAASRARVAVIQAPPAQNMSNRFYAVHPRRNDRFVSASPMMRAIFREIDFTEFHFTRHMLCALRDRAPDRYALIRDELQMAWTARMRLLLTQIETPVVLFWFSRHAPGNEAEHPELVEDPAFVSKNMIDALREEVLLVVDATVSAEAMAENAQGKVFSDLEAAAAAEVLGPSAHTEAAETLIPVITELVGG